MKVTFAVQELKLALAKLAGVVANKSTEAIYRTVRVFTRAGVVYIQGIDIDTTMTLALLGAKADAEANVCFEFAFLNAIFLQMPSDEAVIKLTGESEAILSADKGRIRGRMKTYPTAPFTDLPLVQVLTTDKPTNGFSLPLPSLKEQIGLVDFTVPAAEGRHVVASALLEATATDLNLVGTNGLVLSVSTLPVPAGVAAFSFAVPKPALELVNKLEGGLVKTVTISDNEGAFFFDTDIESVSYNKTYGEFPNFRSIVPKSGQYPTALSVGKEVAAKLETVKAFCVVTEAEKERPVSLRYDGAGTLTLVAVKEDKNSDGDTYTDVGVAALPVAGTGPACTVKVDLLKIKPWLEHATFPVTIFINNGSSIVDMHSNGSTPKEPKYRFLVMPMRDISAGGSSSVPVPVVEE